MLFWFFMLAMDLLIPLIMIGFGRAFLLHAPKKINSVFGYRTSMSMKNQDTWEFAHKHFGKLWFRCGLILLPLSIIPLLFVLNNDRMVVRNVGLIIVAIQLVLLIGTIFPIEAALKKTFDQKACVGSWRFVGAIARLSRAAIDHPARLLDFRWGR